jgi:hypothetical protein
MGDQVLLDEIDDLKEVIDNLKQELVEFKDVSDAKIEDLTALCDKIKDKTEAEWKMRLKAADREAREKNDTILLELEMMRQAFSGDIGGWAKKETATKEWYENEDTGEVREDEPEVMYVARSMAACDEAKEIIKETEELRVETAALKKKNKELTLTLNKTKTENNAFSKQDKAWKESAKVVFKSMNNVKSQLDAQMDQIMDGLQGCTKASRRCHFFVPKVKEAQDKYQGMQERVNKQEEVLMRANAEIRNLTTQLDEATYRVNRLSSGIDAEVERLVKPMREKMSDAMVSFMKEKAGRAQERKEFADQWPNGHLMPTVLMQNRCMDADERARRVKKYHDKNANVALTLEIKANVLEATKWEMKYDDYGREFYEHMDTKETSEEKPAIIDYKPPPGRNEKGNAIIDRDKINMWAMKADGRGRVYFEHKKTQEISYDDPAAYPIIPKGKPADTLAAEAAELVLLTIKGKIQKHIRKKKREIVLVQRKQRQLDARNTYAETMKQIKEDKPGYENYEQLTESLEAAEAMEDVYRAIEKEVEKEVIEKEQRRKAGEEIDDDDEDGDPDEDLSKYQFDIETVEMMASKFAPPTKVEPTPQQKREQMFAFNEGSEARKFDKDDYMGPSLLDTEPDKLDLDELRDVLETLAMREEKYEKALGIVRNNINDFSYILLDRYRAADLEKLRLEREKRELERQERLKYERKKTKKEAKIRARQKAAEAKESAAKFAELSASQAESGGGEADGEDGAVPKETLDEGEEGQADAKDKDTKDEKKEEVEGDVVDEKKADDKKADETKADDKAVDAKEGDAKAGDAKEGDAKAEDKDTDPDALGGDGDAISIDNATLYTMDMSDDEDFEQLDNDDNLEEDSLMGGKVLADPDILIYGDISIMDPSQTFDDGIVATSRNLINFAVFCGYTNMHIEEAPEEANLEFSLRPEDMNETFTSDDQWLTSSFFVSITKDRVDAIKELVSMVYDPDLGLLNSSPLATTRLTTTAEEMARGGKRSVNRPYTPSVSAATEKLTTAHALWKSQQLMAEVVRFQCQKSAVRDAYGNRFKDYNYNPDQRRVSRMSMMDGDVPVASLAAQERPVMFTVKKVVAYNVSDAVWADQQPQFVEVAIGGWSTKVPKQVASGRALVWNDLELSALIPLIRLQLDDVTVQFFDDHELMAHTLVATGELNAAQVLGYNCGKDVTLSFDMKDRKGSAKGRVDVMVQADHYNEKKHGHFFAGAEHDPDNIVNVETNLVESEVDHVHKVPILPSVENPVRAAEGDTEIVVDSNGDEHGKIALTARSDMSKLTETSGERRMFDAPKSGREQIEMQEKIGERLQSGRQDSPDGDIDPQFDHLNDEAGGNRETPVRLIHGEEDEEEDDNFNLDDLGRSVAGDGATVGNSVITGISGMNSVSDALSGVYPKKQTLDDEMSNFEGLVADLRGDGVSFIKMVTGDITFNEVKRTGHRIGVHTSAKIPDFNKTTSYLHKKSQIHMANREMYTKRTDEAYLELTPMLKQMYEFAKERAEEAQVNVKKVLDSAADTARKVKDISAELGDMREPARKPTEPVLPDLPPVPYVQLIPETGQLDEKKKKKKQIPNKDLKDILDDILMGKLDDKEWDFGKYWPSKAQAIKINKARADRNEVLDAARADSLEGRNRLVEKYLSDLNQWEIDEKKRRVNLEKTKKKSRKANLKLDCFMERADRREKELDIAQLNFAAIEALQNLHVKSMRDVQSFKIKCYLEAERQKNTSGKLRKRMLMALDARKRAMELPRGALNHVQFEEMRSKAEEALRTLRLEVLECKSLLVQEGVRLRTLHAEEVSILKNEYLRTSICLETLRQAKDLGVIVEKNQHEVLHLLEAMEKLRMIEADKDDRGLKDTVDNAGERYIPGKKFKSIEIEQCQRLIDLVMAKIDLVEGLALSSARSLTCLTEGITSKWATDTTIVRDSWVENSDYERAARFSSDAVTWLSVQRKKLGDLQKFIGKETEEMKLQIAASDEQSELMRANQESDTRYVTESALSIVNVMQEHIADIREVAANDKRELEQQVTDVTRECQQLRDALMRSKQASDETSKLLWSMIATLQTAAQSLSARMDIIIEERDKIVVHSRLESDKMKHQLRQERKHSANLMFILHSQRGTIKYLHDVCKLYVQRAEQDANARKLERSIFRKEIWEQIFAFTRLSTDVNELFVFFASRLANLAGARKELNNDLANNGGARILAAMCHSPRPIVRKFAARALGSLGWDGYVETRILLWDTVCYWKGFKTAVIEKDRNAFEAGFDTFKDTGKFEALLNIEGSVDEFVPAGNMSLRTIIKQRRQWALRATRRLEGPNATNQQMINMRDGVVPSLLQLAVKDGDDWEIAKNAALAISIASYEMSNHNDMTNSQDCIRCLLRMCESPDAEVQTHAAVTIANLCHKDEHAQLIFGNSNAIPVLIKMCESLVVDVLEGATCALANLTCFCDPNCERVMEHGGVGVMVNLVAHAYSENLLDLDQNDEVQANAMEMLANVSRVNSEHTTKYFTTKVINSIVLMCAAVNIQVKRHAPLVMGNIGQSQMCRQLIGDSGGVEALFLVLEENDNTIKANTLWALCNLMWHPGNQERAGRFMNEMYRSMDSDFMPIKINAAILLANALYYSNSNRVRFLEMDGAMDTIMNMVVAREDKTFVESALRAILSLSYLDNVALWLGELDEPIPIFVAFIQPPYLSRECMRYSLEILSNLCVHHGNRAKILDANGTAAIVALSTDPDVHIQDLAAQVVDYLGDVTPAEVLAKAKMDIGLERMVLLATNADKTVRAVAAESIGEEIWHNPDKQRHALELGALEALLAIIHNPEEEVTSLLPALWSLRNVMHNNVQAQEQIAHRDALSVLTGCIQRVAVGQYGDQSEKILEALLSSLTASIANHERNSRRLLVVGLEALMDIADGKLGHVTGTTHIVAQSLKGEGVVALAKSILLMLGPYNYVVCRNCHKKQELVGQSCYACGYRLRVEVTDAADRGKMYKSQPLMSATAPSGGAGGLGKHGSGAQTKNLLMMKTLQGSASVNDLSSTSSLASEVTLGRDSPELQEEKGGSPILLGSQSTSTLHKKKPNMLSGRPMTETDAELDAVAVAEELREEEEGNGGGGDEGSVEGKKTD